MGMETLSKTGFLAAAAAAAFTGAEVALPPPGAALQFGVPVFSRIDTGNSVVEARRNLWQAMQGHASAIGMAGSAMKPEGLALDLTDGSGGGLCLAGKFDDIELAIVGCMTLAPMAAENSIIVYAGPDEQSKAATLSAMALARNPSLLAATLEKATYRM